MRAHYVGQLFRRLDAEPDFDQTELALLEWMQFGALRFSERRPRALHRELARSPDFFVGLIKMIFLPDPESGVEEPPPDDVARASEIASQACGVLGSWSLMPGTDPDGAIDAHALEDWVKSARKLCDAAGRRRIGDQKVGEILSAPPRSDEPWPPEPVRELIETVRSRDLERGFQIGTFNRQGVTRRNPTDGGDQERDLVARYRRDADLLRFDCPRTAKCLDSLAETYEGQAQQQDHMAEQFGWPS